MSYAGDINLGDTIDIKFATVNSSGVPTTLAGSPVVSAYVGNGTTEITAGITLSVDFDSRTGLNNVRVVASGGNGFAAATDVQLVITTGTVGGSSVVGYPVASFSINKRAATVWAEAMEGAITAIQMMRGFAAALLGKANGLATTTANYRDLADTKNRIQATVDADGNRSAVTRDLT